MLPLWSHSHHNLNSWFVLPTNAYNSQQPFRQEFRKQSLPVASNSLCEPVCHCAGLAPLLLASYLLLNMLSFALKQISRVSLSLTALFEALFSKPQFGSCSLGNWAVSLTLCQSWLKLFFQLIQVHHCHFIKEQINYSDYCWFRIYPICISRLFSLVCYGC